jgi:hypothetical protein
VRFALALGRAQAVTTAVGIAAALVLADWLVGARMLAIPFLQDAVEAGRVFPALLAGCGALVVATDWDDHERTGARSVRALAVGRRVAGAAIAFVPALAVTANLQIVGALYLLLGVLVTVLPRHWWLALPALLYLQLYLPPDLLPQ